MKPGVSLDVIQEFLAQPRIAMVGVSRDPRHFSRALFEAFCRRGYDMVPVHPQAVEVEGRPCFPRVQDVIPPVANVLLMTTGAATDQVLRDCAEAGVRRVWFYRATGQGSVTPASVEFCRLHKMQVVPGDCPFMYFPHPGVLHGAHGLLRKIAGRYPSHVSA